VHFYCWGELPFGFLSPTWNSRVGSHSPDSSWAANSVTRVAFGDWLFNLKPNCSAQLSSFALPFPQESNKDGWMILVRVPEILTPFFPEILAA
jgi:hypothetical protein